MGNTILLDPSYMTNAGVVVSGGTAASTSMALENVITPQPSEFARFSNATPANTYMVFDLTPAVLNEPLNTSEWGVFIGYANLWREYSGGTYTASTVRIRAATSEANLTAAPTVDTGSLTFTEEVKLRNVWPRGVHHLSIISGAPQYRFWRIDFDGETQLDGYVEVGVVAIGPVFRTSNPIGNGWSFGVVKTLVGQTSMGGQRYRRSVSGTNSLEATFQLTTQTEADDLHDLIRNRGEAKAMLCAISPDDTSATMRLTAWGHMTMTQPIAVPHYGLWQTTIRVEEMP